MQKKDSDIPQMKMVSCMPVSRVDHVVKYIKLDENNNFVRDNYILILQGCQ